MVARWDRVWRAHQHNTDDDEDSAEDSEGDKAVSSLLKRKTAWMRMLSHVDAEPGGDEPDEESEESVSDDQKSVDEVSEDSSES